MRDPAQIRFSLYSKAPALGRPCLEVMIEVHLPFHHVLQVGQPSFPRGDNVDGVGAEGTVDKAPGMQVSQGIGDLEQQVHDHLHVQHGELGPLQARTKSDQQCGGYSGRQRPGGQQRPEREERRAQ